MISRPVTCKTDRSVKGSEAEAQQRSEYEGMIRSARISVMLPVQQYRENEQEK